MLLYSTGSRDLLCVCRFVLYCLYVHSVHVFVYVKYSVMFL